MAVFQTGLAKHWIGVLLAAFLTALTAIACQARGETPALRVCADPNNLPFSNEKREGFENKLAELVAHDLDMTVDYVWWAQRRGFARNTLKTDKCDLWPGVATGVETMTVTKPYYRSTYVFVSRAPDHLDIASFDDPRLRHLIVGVQMIGNDATNTPPAHALSRRGIIENVRGFMLYGDYRRPSPPAEIIEAVAADRLDVAIVWGPFAGYFAAKQNPPLVVTPLAAPDDGPSWPMAFDISMGVRKGDTALRDKFDVVLDRHRAEIGALLDRYHVPLAAATKAVAGGG